jgi:Cys-Gly metallodipeptidase DUG1
MKCTLQHAGKWWVASPKHWNFTAASKAVERVWGVKPDLTREGGRSVTTHFALFTRLNNVLVSL